jgi:hypothetical protein
MLCAQHFSSSRAIESFVFGNHDVNTDLAAVLDAIYAALANA